MSVRLDPAVLHADAILVSPPAQRACEDHSFELPTGIYVAMAALLFGFLAVLAIGLANPNLAVPTAINFVFLTAFFTVPVLFVRGTANGNRALRWSEFMRNGIATATGHSAGKDAVVLILLLPALIFCWSLSIVLINALV
jgi:hypothetical protein